MTIHPTAPYRTMTFLLSRLSVLQHQINELQKTADNLETYIHENTTLWEQIGYPMTWADIEKGPQPKEPQ